MIEKIYHTRGASKAIIIGGYLGSGKTTLINSILASKQAKEYKIAVLENEFGSIGLDGKLIRSDGIELREIEGGCVCCTQQGKMVQELEILSELGSELIIIEASGVADPNSIASELFSPTLFGKVSRGLSICVVDAVNFQHYKQDKIALRQMAFADVVVITKGNLSDVDQQYLNDIAGGARVISSEIQNLADKLLSFISSQTNHKPHLPIEQHKTSFQSFTFESEVPFDKDSFRYVINSLLKTDLYYRIKGIIKCNGNDSFFFESVRYYGEEKPLTDLGYDEGFLPIKSQIVFIGNNVDKNHIQDTLFEALAH